MRARLLGIVLPLTLLSGCYVSHGPEDRPAMRDGGAVTRDAGGPVECTGVPPSCFAPDARGCCASVAAVCSRGTWTCPGSGACEMCPPPDCSALTEAECIGSPDCGPLYDDVCCSLCLPGGGCADCTQPQMYQCGTIAAVCASDPPACGLPTPGWPCRGGVADCSEAVPVLGGRCDVPGCVQAIEAGCTDGCSTECVPVTPNSCTATCERLPPSCRDGTVPEGDGLCYTDRCIDASACEPAPTTFGP